MNNIMTNNKDYFKHSEARMHWCFDHYFLPIYNYNSHPAREMIVYPDTQFFSTATWNKEARERIKNDERLPRRQEYLIPTAFLFESDKVSIKEQLANIKEDAVKHILSMTYSGNKSIHIIVPIRLSDSYEINSSGMYKFLWKKVAGVIFKDTSILDTACATIGRLSRMPGATRLRQTPEGHLDTVNREGCKEQTCIYLNETPSFIDLKVWIKDYGLVDLAQSIQNNLRLSLYRPQSNGNPLDHLSNSCQKYPTPCKQTALMVLKDGNIPSSDKLPENGSYISTIYYLKNKFPELAKEFVTLVKQAHPTCLPRSVDDYLRQ